MHGIQTQFDTTEELDMVTTFGCLKQFSCSSLPILVYIQLFYVKITSNIVLFVVHLIWMQIFMFQCVS